jgi:hypothetical protein
MEKRTIGGREDAERLWRFDQGIYAAAAALDRELYLAGAELLPELNFRVGEGHLSCLPLTAAAYEGLREGRLHEGDLRGEDLEMGGYVYLCSMYAENVEVGWEVFRALRGFLAEWKGVMGAYAVTAAGRRACERLGMRVVREDAEDGRRAGTEIVPVFLERRVD